ncbi:MAG: glycosyltransferase family 39 protein, partial [Anaerolineales bacterium]
MIVVLLAFLLPRIFSLATFVTPDEHLWLSRSANFYMALAQRDFVSTYKKATPGVTIMWAGTASFLILFPEYRGSALGQVDNAVVHNYINKNAKDITTPLDLLQGARIFIVLGNTFVLTLAYLYARRLIGLLPALIGFLLIAFDPFHLALSRLLHTDGSLSNLLLLSLLAFVNFIKDRKPLDLVISGVTAGLSWLTKSPGVFLVPVVGLLALIQMWRTYPSRSGQSPNLIRHIWDNTWPLIAWGMVGLLIFVALWPAMWVNPINSVLSIFGSIQRLAEGGHYAGIFYYGTAGRQVNPAFFYPVTYLWRTTPIVVLGLLSAGWGLLKNQKPFNQEGARLTLLVIFLTVIVFTIGMSMGLKKLDRYLLPAYAPLDIIAGMGWAALFFWIREHKIPLVSKYVAYLMLALVIGTQMFLSLSK